MTDEEFSRVFKRLDDLAEVSNDLSVKVGELTGELRVWRQTRCVDHADKIRELDALVQNQSRCIERVTRKLVIIGSVTVILTQLLSWYLYYRSITEPIAASVGNLGG